MTETAVVVRPQPQKEEQLVGQVFDFAKNTEDEAVRLAIALLGSPVVCMVVATAIIELLQGVEVYKGKKHIEVKQGYGPPGSPGATEIYWVKEKEPLVSQGLATTLESVIITSETFKNIGGGDIAKLLAGLLIK